MVSKYILIEDKIKNQNQIKFPSRREQIGVISKYIGNHKD